jgi:hypothetical protein
MSILSETKAIIESLNIPVETGVFKNIAPETYIVLVPLADSYPLSADDKPEVDYQELRISLFSKGNYMRVKNEIVKKLIDNSFYVTERRFNGFDTGSGYYQYSIDIAKNYLFKEE